MAKIELNLDVIGQDKMEEFAFAVRSFENFINKVNPKQPSSILKLTSAELEIVLGTLQDTEFSLNIPDFDEISMALLDAIKDVEREVEPKYRKYTTIVIEGKEKEVYEYLIKVIENAKIKLSYLKEGYNNSQNDMQLVNKIQGLLEKNKYTEIDLLDKMDRLIDSCGDIAISEFLLSLVHRNLYLLEEEKKNQKTFYSIDELNEMKRSRYIETYGLILENDVTLETIEEVIKASVGVSLTFLKLHPEIFSVRKELYLNNLRLLKEKVGDIKVVIDRNPEALLDENLTRNLKLISMYDISLKELLYYREKALTDLSYFGVLDLMIENGYFDIKKLLDKNNIQVKERTVLRLLGFKNLEIQGSFPLNEDEINTLLAKKSTVLKNGMATFDKCVLDLYKKDFRTYSLDGVFISRPKVLRNIESETNITIDNISCNGFFTSEEMNSLIKTINEYTGTYQKVK